MARRTVENINGFVMARQPALSSAVPKKPTALLSRPKLVTLNESAVKKKSTASTSKAVNPSTLTKKKENQNSRPLVKKETPKRSVDTKTDNINSKIKPTEIKIVQNKIKNESKTEKSVSMLGNRTTSVLSSMSDDREEYEDDFEDYESDFESDNSIESFPGSPTESAMTVNQSNPNGGMMSGRFALPVCVEEKLEPFLDEKYEVDSLERTVEMGLENFKTAGKRKREQEAKKKIMTRGNVLMGMIKMDRVSFTFLDLPPTPYEQYIKMYGRSNMAQIQTQTHDDNADKEIQTNDIELVEKWTQRPIMLTNEMNCSSLEYQRAKLGVGGGAPDTDCNRRRHQGTSTTPSVDADRLCAVGRTMLSVLEHELSPDGAERGLVANDVEFSGGHRSPAVDTIAFLVGRPVISVQFARITQSATEFLITTHEVKDLNYQFVLCIWSVSIMRDPEFVLKCPNRVTSLCTILKSINGLILAAQIDGSICVWDLRESRLHHQMIDRPPCPLRSPSFSTALSVDQGHRSKIVGINTVTYRNGNVTDKEELPDEVCSLDEDFVLVLWTMMDSWTDAAGILEHNSPGTAPWSTVRLVKLQTFETQKIVPRCVSDGVMATCMCLNDNQDAFIGTNSGLVFRFNLGEHKSWPQYYIHKDKGACFSVSWLDICPFDSNYFLAACTSGEVIVFHANRRKALRWLIVTPDLQRYSAPVLKAQWCSGFPGIVVGLDSLFSVHLWDLYDDISTPIASASFSGKIVTSMSLTSTRKSRNTHMGLSFVDGAVEIHLLKTDKRNIAKLVNDSGHDRSNHFAQFLADNM